MRDSSFAFDRRAWAVLFWQLVSRSPSGMVNLGFVFFGEGVLGSFAIGGLLVAAYNIAYAIGSPLGARLLGAIGTAPVLLTYAAISGGALAAMAVVQPAPAAAVALATLAGLTFPPVTPLARSMYPRIVGNARLEPVYAIDAVAQEFIWIVGPLIATAAAWLLGPSTALLAAAIMLVIGAVVFSFLPATREFGNLRIRADAGGSAPAIGASLGVLSALIATGFFLVTASAMSELFVVAELGYSGPETGFVLAAAATGSLVAGITIAKRRLGRGSVAIRLSMVLAGALLAGLTDGFVWMLIAFFVLGMGLAPTFAAFNTIIALRLPNRHHAVAYAVTHSGQLVGLAIGTAVAGAMVDLSGSALVIWSAVASSVVAVLLALIVPSLRRGLGVGRD
ncbi:MFS transporter [Ruicaihuangia caeni]|uniref:MFS transporter n=1 Tax=Ruicaihuangia caeni TaxID=3042517 RepID=UPI00338FFFD1